MKWLILLIPLLFLIIPLFVTGCMDRDGYQISFNSYDNLILEDGWNIAYHTSDFVCCVGDRYFVSYMITNGSDSREVYGFIYDSKYDELIYSPDGLTPDLPKEVIDWN